MVTRERLTRLGSVFLAQDVEARREWAEVVALCEAALDAREALHRILQTPGDYRDELLAVRSLLSHLDTGRAAAPEEGATG